ncbi:phosphoethanolamine transferase [Acinetobacter sp. SAAs470]|uniref:phosphoethanolamine transferase n=1 Tax=unclassified Acinetobacter TaxID=196816 RepID=UPI00397727F9
MLSFRKKLNTIRNFIPLMRLTVFNLILALWLGIALNFRFFEQIKTLTPYQGFKAQLLLLATICIVVAFYNLVIQLLTWKWTTKASAIILVILGGVSAYFVTNFGVIMNAEQIQNMMQTDQREVRDLLSIKYILWMLSMVVVPIILILLIRIQPEKLSKLILKKIMAMVASLIVIAGLLFFFYVDYAAIFREHRYLKGMISPQNVIASSLSYYKKQRPQKDLPLVRYGQDAKYIQTAQAKTPSEPKLMVLVVGETARAESFALNGYTKNTTPKLAQQDIINFTQVSSCGTATAVSVPCMFSGMPRRDYDEQLAMHREGLLDIVQRAGYKVTWIENNSGCKGVCDRVENYQIPAAIKQKWCDAEGECLDEILVDALKAYIETIPKDDKTPRLVVLHQMGSHGPAYFKRTTANFKKFQPTCDTNAIQGCSQERLINTYDNSILYTDHVLSQMIDTLKNVNQYQTGFWYLSDHGESTGEKGMYLHGTPYAIAPSQQTHIPMLMWFSPQWKKSEAANMACLNKLKNSQLSQDNLFPTLLDLLQIHTQVSDSKNDMLQHCDIK